MKSFKAFVCVTAFFGCAPWAYAGGDLVMNWTAPYGDWTKGLDAGEVSFNWYPAAANGRVFLKGLSAGDHTFGLSRAFGFGPLVVPRVRVAEGKTTQLDMSFHTDYHAMPGARTLRGSVFVQPFVARGDSIIKAAAYFVTLPPPRGVKYSICNAGPDGPPVGPMAFRPPSLNAYVGSWCHGQVPVTPGRMYCLRVEGAKGATLEVKLSDTFHPMLPLVVDGKLVPDASLAGWVESDPPGIITTMACVEGKVNPKPDKERCQGEFGQTFIAGGTSLGLIDFRPFVPDVTGEIGIEVIVRRGGPKGAGIGRQQVTGPNGTVLQAVWAPGEIGLTPGELYCVEFRNPAGGGFKMSRVAGELYPRGTLVMDEIEVGHYDLDANIVEYGEDTASPQAPASRILSSDGVARIEYTVPRDPDVRKLQIRYRCGGHNERWPLNPAQDNLLAEVDVVPGQRGVVHYEGLANFETYSYALYAIDVNGNCSSARVDAGFPGKGPVLPAQATLLNGTFASVEAMGARAANWDIRVNRGDPAWQAFSEADGSTAFGWKAADDTEASLLQTVTLHPGRRYELTAQARCTGSASAMIHPEGPTDAQSTALSADWKTLRVVFTADIPGTTIALSGSTKAGAEIRFTNVQIRDVTMDVAR